MIPGLLQYFWRRNMREVHGIKISPELWEVIEASCKHRSQHASQAIDAEEAAKHITTLLNTFTPKNNALLQQRKERQQQFVSESKKETGEANNTYIASAVSAGLVPDESQQTKTLNKISPASPIQDGDILGYGSQGVLPIDKVQYATKGAVRFHPFDFTAAQFITEAAEKNNTSADAEARKFECSKLDEFFPFNGVKWIDIERFEIKKDNNGLGQLYAINGDQEVQFNNSGNAVFKGYSDSTFLLEKNGIIFEFNINEEGTLQLPIFCEANKTVINDLEDAGHPSAKQTLQGYWNLLGLLDGSLSYNDGKGKERKIPKDTEYTDAKTGDKKTLKRSVTALVRDVGPHMESDPALISFADGLSVPQKFVDIFITCLQGHQYHVSPKMQAADEVALTLEYLSEVETCLNVPDNYFKIGIMYEEVGVNIAHSVDLAAERIFFINSGFLDYTGSFIETMSHLGPIVAFTELGNQRYKQDYEAYCTAVGLLKGVPQVGAGMYPFIQYVQGCIESKEGQMAAGNTTGWVPNPNFGVAFDMVVAGMDTLGIKKQKCDEYADPKKIAQLIEGVVTFPQATKEQLKHFKDHKHDESSDLNRVTYELLAYAQPWVQNGIGCSGVMNFDGKLIMEDRATMRIKIAWLRNYLQHVEQTSLTLEDVADSLISSARKLDEQHQGKENYKPLLQEGKEQLSQAFLRIVSNPEKPEAYTALHEVDNTISAVFELITNVDQELTAYVEKPMLRAYNREQKRKNINDSTKREAAL